MKAGDQVTVKDEHGYVWLAMVTERKTKWIPRVGDWVRVTSVDASKGAEVGNVGQLVEISLSAGFFPALSKVRLSNGVTCKMFCFRFEFIAHRAPNEFKPGDKAKVIGGHGPQAWVEAD